MARTILDTELNELHQQVINLGSLVSISLEYTLDAVERRDLATCGLVLTLETDIDKQRIRVEQYAFRLLTLQQPLGSRDLRFLLSCIAIASDLERVGAGTKGIAQLFIRMASLQRQVVHPIHKGRIPFKQKKTRKEAIFSASAGIEASLIEELVAFGQRPLSLLVRTMRAFAEQNMKVACTLWHEDDVIDTCYHILRHDMLNFLEGSHALPALQQDAFIIQRVTYLLWMAHKLERMADHCTKICDRIVFIMQGKRNVPLYEKNL